MISKLALKNLTDRCHEVPNMDYVEYTVQKDRALVRFGRSGMRTVKVQERIPDKELGFTKEEIKARRDARRAVIKEAKAQGVPVPKTEYQYRLVDKRVRVLLKSNEVHFTEQELEEDTFFTIVINMMIPDQMVEWRDAP